ncbi:MAG: RNA chaperone Hfq [Clostridiales bacterium]|jgi:host factor-I protein|nr:RNA chaperone Hfq [Clostridiales bacterium]
MNSNASTTTRFNHERHGFELKLQDAFLNQCRRERVPVAIHFVDQSIKYGQIIGFDHHSIILRTNGHQRLVFKSAICMIDPQEDFSYIFNDPQRGEDSAKPFQLQ